MTQPPPWPEKPSAWDTAGGTSPPPSSDPPPPPETPVPETPAPETPAPEAQPLPGQPPHYPPPPYGTAAPSGPTQPLYPGTPYGAPAAPPPGYGYPYQPAPRTNGMSVASMVVSIVSAAGLCCYGFGGLLGIVGAILGHVARRQVKQRNESGEGMALAGIIVGWIAFGLGLVVATVMVVLFVLSLNDPAFQSEF